MAEPEQACRLTRAASDATRPLLIAASQGCFSSGRVRARLSFAVRRLYNTGNMADPLIQELWQEHRASRFPKGFRGKDVNGVDFVMLDADIAGCVSRFLSRGTLDARRAAILGLCYRNAGNVVPILNEEGAQYFWRLERMAELVLKELAKTEPTDA